jgi:chitodextrinase
VLNWDNNVEPDLANYKVFRATASGGPYTLIASPTASAYTATGLVASTQYWFKVSAIDTSDNESAQTAFATATTDAPPVDVTPPAAPTGLTSTGGAGQVTLNWSNNVEGDLASYRVKRATVSGGPYTVITTRTTSDYVDLGLTASTTYHYVVSAVDTSGNESSNSAQTSATTNATVVTPGTFPPPTPPQVVVNEAYPATPDITLAAGASINGALSIGHRIIKLTPGFYGSQQIAPRTGSYIYCQTGVATFDGGEVLNRLFITGATSASNVTLRGLEVKRFFAEAPGTGGRGIIVTPSGSTNWKFIQCHIWHGNNAAFRLTGSAHQVINCQIHDFAKYAFNDGSGHTIKGCEIYRIAINDGTQLVPPSTDSNRGVSKFAAGGTGGYTFEDCYLHDVNGQGFWLDGARGGAVCRRIKSVNVERSTFFAEVCWGPNTVSDIDVVGGAKGIGSPTSSLYDYPSHGAVGVSLSPDTTFSRIRARNVGIGIQILNSSSHPTLTEGTSVHTAAEVRPHLGIGNCDIRDIDISATRYAIGFTGDAFNDFPDTQRPDITISGVQLYSKTGNPQYGAAYDPAFRWGGDFPMTLAEWNAYTHTFLTK